LLLLIFSSFYWLEDLGNFSVIEYPVAPWTMEAVLEYIKQSYDNPPVYILENGTPMTQHKDTHRVEYMNAYIGGVLKSIRNGSDTRGYFVWSFMDLFELIGRYDYGYGLYSVNFSDPHRKRSPRLSAHWYSDFLKGKTSFLDSKGIKELQSNFSSSS
jgi:beta-glucosidase